ncbi:MAG: hypothetical protein ACFFCS_03145 [Candidatus Hodarchaeota archaeon]
MPYKTLKVTDFDKELFDWTTKINEDEIAFVIDDIEKIVYVWNGQKVSMMKKYKGGTLATKVKAAYQFYGFKTITVNQGEETGPLRAEVDALLAGTGTELSDVELDTLQPIATTTTSAEAIAAVPRIDYKAKSQELEEALEAEKNKSESLKEEMEALKSAQEIKLKEELDAVKRDYDEKIKDLEDAKAKESEKLKDLEASNEKLKSDIDSLKKEMDEAVSKVKEEAKGEPESLQKDLDEIARLKQAKVSADSEISTLKNNISALQSEITDLKNKLETAKPADDSGKISDLITQLDQLQKSNAEEIQNLKSSYEDKIASLQNDNESIKRQLLEAEEKVKSSEELSFAPISELDKAESDAGDAEGLMFVNPYAATTGVKAKVDPLSDLKSFLNTVDPSKPLNPELKNLLNTIVKRMQEDKETIQLLGQIKMQVKDRMVGSLLEEVINKIKEKAQ